MSVILLCLPIFCLVPDRLVTDKITLKPDLTLALCATSRERMAASLVPFARTFP
jgi:hypothetical protein